MFMAAWRNHFAGYVDVTLNEYILEFIFTIRRSAFEHDVIKALRPL